MKKEYSCSMLWINGSLSYLEQLCAKSCVDAGHHTILYTYEPVGCVPEGIELRDAAEVLPLQGFLLHSRTGSPALHSDLFRYKLLEKDGDTIWVDTDAYCLRKFEPVDGHFYGWESEKHVNGGVLALPPDSDTLRELLAFTSDEFAIPPWLPDRQKRVFEEAREAGNPIHASDMPWGTWGPHAVTHFLRETGEIRYALPRSGLYPFSFKDRVKMIRTSTNSDDYLNQDTYSIHFYGRRMRPRLAREKEGVPRSRSLIGKLLEKHKIDPFLAPIQVKKADYDGLDSQAIPDRPNLTMLADKYGSDKGSKKHRYTELYHMLFSPFRDRPIRFMEMGLLIGGPEHGEDPNRPTDDLPSVRMWLDYFSKAHIIGLDISDFTFFDHPRFDFIRCDMDERNQIKKAVSEQTAFDIVIDDASHASHHQQNAFLEVFPKVKSGGLYIIEDLRWQPKAYEIPRVTKTAELFQSYLNNQKFTHSNSEVESSFNNLRSLISGAFIFQAKFQKHRKDQVLVVHKV